MLSLPPPDPTQQLALVHTILPQVLLASGRHPQHWQAARRLSAIAQEVLRPVLLLDKPSADAADLADQSIALEELHAYLALNESFWNAEWYLDWLEVQRRLRQLMPSVAGLLAQQSQ